MTTKRALPKGVEVTDSGALRIWFMLKGKRVREPVGLAYSLPNCKVASRLRDKVIDAIDHEAFVYRDFFPDSKQAANDPNGKTFSEIAELWFKEKVKEGVKANTKVKYRQILDQVWTGRYGARPIASFKASAVKLDLMEDEFFAEASAVRYNDALIPLRGTFDLAVELDLLEASPAAKLKNRPRVRADADPFEQAEVIKILRAANDLYGMPMADYFMVAFLTGMRPSEQIALLKTDVDMPRQRVLVSKSLNAGVVEPPKTAAGRRYIELVTPARDALARRLGTALNRTHLFYHPELDKPFTEPRPVREAFWDHAVEEAGVRYRTMYTTRHTFATQALMAGAHPMWVATQMGHEDTKLIYSTYSKWLPDQLEIRESRKLEQAYENTLVLGLTSDRHLPPDGEALPQVA